MSLLAHMAPGLQFLCACPELELQRMSHSHQDASLELSHQPFLPIIAHLGNKQRGNLEHTAGPRHRRACD